MQQQNGQDLFSEFLELPPPPILHPQLPAGKRLPGEKRKGVLKRGIQETEQIVTPPKPPSNTMPDSEYWKMLLFQEKLCLTMCNTCRNRFWNDPNRILYLRNEEARMGITLCSKCAAYNIKVGANYHDFTQIPVFDNQAQEEAYHQRRS